jgi:hypothetical protein
MPKMPVHEEVAGERAREIAHTIDNKSKDDDPHHTFAICLVSRVSSEIRIDQEAIGFSGVNKDLDGFSGMPLYSNAMLVIYSRPNIISSVNFRIFLARALS